MSERITIDAQAEKYEDAITEAMAKLRNYLPEDAWVYRQAENPDATEMKDWCVEDVTSSVSPGNQWISVAVDFLLVGSDL